MTKAAALLAWAPGLGCGLACVYAIWHFADHGQIRTFLGYPVSASKLTRLVGNWSTANQLEFIVRDPHPRRTSSTKLQPRRSAVERSTGQAAVDTVEQAHQDRRSVTR